MPKNLPQILKSSGLKARSMCTHKETRANLEQCRRRAQSVDVLGFPSPTGYVFVIFRFDFIKFGVFHTSSSEMGDNFPQELELSPGIFKTQPLHL